MWAAVVFVLVLVLVFGGSFALNVRSWRRRRQMTENERAAWRPAIGSSTTAPLVNWIMGLRGRRD